MLPILSSPEIAEPCHSRLFFEYAIDASSTSMRRLCAQKKEKKMADTSNMNQEELDLWSDINNPNNDADMDDWADSHNPNNDEYIDS